MKYVQHINLPSLCFNCACKFSKIDVLLEPVIILSYGIGGNLPELLSNTESLNWKKQILHYIQSSCLSWSRNNIFIRTPGQALFELLTDSCPILRVGLNRDSSSVFCCCSNIALFLLRSASVAAFSTANLFSSAFISLFNSCTWLECVCSRVFIASWCLQFEFCYRLNIITSRKNVSIHSKRLLFILLF